MSKLYYYNTKSKLYSTLYLSKHMLTNNLFKTLKKPEIHMIDEETEPCVK